MEIQERTVRLAEGDPAIATEIADRLGCGTAPAFDISAAYGGFGLAVHGGAGLSRRWSSSRSARSPTGRNG